MPRVDKQRSGIGKMLGVARCQRAASCSLDARDQHVAYLNADDTPAYLVTRFDRFKKKRHIEKLACEDMHDTFAGMLTHSMLTGDLRQRLGGILAERLDQLR